jgi:hypothetical protein
VEVNPVTTHSQLHFVLEEIQTQASSRISPVSRHVRSINAKHIRGRANPPTDLGVRGADLSGRRNNVPYSSVFARSSQNISRLSSSDIPSSWNISSQSIVPALRNVCTDTVVKTFSGRNPEIRIDMPADAINGNCGTSAAATLPMGTSYGIQPTQPRVCCTTSVADCNSTWSSEPLMQTVENVIHDSHGDRTTVQSGFEVVADNVINVHPSRTSENLSLVPRASSPTPSFHAQCSNVSSQNGTPSIGKRQRSRKDQLPKSNFRERLMK